MKKNYSPLRYPGGKGQLSEYVLDIIKQNNLVGGTYVEPYAGGSGIAMFLLLNGYVKRVYINDVDYSIYSFWYSILNHTEEFINLIQTTDVTINEWERQKNIFKHNQNHSILESGFATFFLNRTNRSGILKAGPIGGHSQNSSYSIDCRYNKSRLIELICNIASKRSSIRLSNLDAIEFFNNYKKYFKKKTLVYLDPPYYKKGHQLYINFYKHKDHEELANYIKYNLNCKWILSYDNEDAIREIYKNITAKNINISYSISSNKKGKEIMFFSERMIAI